MKACLHCRQICPGSMGFFLLRGLLLLVLLLFTLLPLPLPPALSPCWSSFLLLLLLLLLLAAAAAAAAVVAAEVVAVFLTAVVARCTAYVSNSPRYFNARAWMRRSSHRATRTDCARDSGARIRRSIADGGVVTGFSRCGGWPVLEG